LLHSYSLLISKTALSTCGLLTIHPTKSAMLKLISKYTTTIRLMQHQ
jgi:hypothetical protein